MVISDGTRMMKFWGGDKNNFIPWNNVSEPKKTHQNVKLCVAEFGWLAVDEDIQSEEGHIKEIVCWRGTGPGLHQRDTRVRATLMTDKQISFVL